MSFLNGPADCGPINPLAQLSKTSAVDNSLQRDRFVQQGGSSSSQLRHLPSSSTSSSSQPQLNQRPGQLNQLQGPRASPQPFDLASLQNALHGSQRAGSPGGALQHRQPPPGWGIDDIRQFEQQNQNRQGPQQGWEGMEAGWNRAGPQQQQQQQQHRPVAQHDAQFDQAWNDPQQQATQHQQQPFYQQQYQPSPFGQLGGGGFQQRFGGQAFGNQFPQQQSLDKGKGREISWESHFDQYASIAEVDQKGGDLDEGKTKADEPAVKPNEGDELEEIWKAHQGNNMPEGGADLASWEAEFSQFASGDVASAYEELESDQARRYEEEMGDDVLGTTDETGYPRLGTYTFETKNPYLTHHAPLDQARSMSNSLASLSDRALALEAALQSPNMPRDTLEEAAAWKGLGDCQTQDEKELAGTRALEESVRVYERIREKGGEESTGAGIQGMGEALMSLAISYTNESYDQAAYLTLHRHLSLLHPKHTKALPPNLTGPQATNPWAIHGLLNECFLNAAREQQSMGTVDPGTQMALGLLYYSNGEFELSADCWSAALSVTPEDFLLWNRLGATLANGGRPEEAIDAYRRALDLNPTYTRSIYNLGVSCLNIGIYREAAEHLLTALSLHQTQPSQPQLLSKDEAVNQSLNLWSTLRRAFFAMDRPDLAEKAVVGADLGQFAGEGFEF